MKFFFFVFIFTQIRLFFKNDYFIKHTFYVVKILRELCCQRPSLQKQIVLSMTGCKKSVIESVSRLTSVFFHEIQITHFDMIVSNIEQISIPRIRGEIIRNLLETFVDAIEFEPQSANLAYLLFNFDLNDIGNSNICIPSKSKKNCFNI